MSMRWMTTKAENIEAPGPLLEMPTFTAPVDVTPGNLLPGAELNKEINALIDASLEAHNRAEPARNYLGGSRLGVECSRALWYEYVGQDKDAGRDFKGKTLRRFRLGHWHEEETVAWMRMAGFDLRSHDKQGFQYGWETAEGKIAGHIDGVLLSGPSALPYPMLWEHKIMKASKWRELQRKGVKEANPVYYAQCQVYMAYMELEHALFQAVNTDTSELWSELVDLNLEDAQNLSDKGLRIVTADDADDLPRIAKQPTDFRCKWCDYKTKCWS